MVLKIEDENDKMRRAKRRSKRLCSKYCEISEVLGYLRAKLNDCKRLGHREKCPLCRQKINYKFYSEQIPEIEKKIELLIAWNKQNYNYSKQCKIKKPIMELREKQQKEHKEAIESYLKENRNTLNKTIRTFNLPEINDLEEKKLWNEAIYLQLDRRGMDENDDLQFII